MINPRKGLKLGCPTLVNQSEWEHPITFLIGACFVAGGALVLMGVDL